IFKRPRQRADTATEARRKQLSQEIKQSVGIGQPLRIGPVRQVNLFFHPFPMELSEWKSIDRENIAIMPLEPALKFQQRFRIRQFARGEVAQAQSDGVST